ncbi:MAG: SDR family oxidoreductase [Anaerolineales bacterium]|nr:SDR family oxidoreductase [Anaerolineales bacterium]
MRLKEKVAIITGGGRGIGRAIASGFAEQGAQVVVASRTWDELQEVTDEIHGRDQSALPILCDVTDEVQVKSMIAETIEAYGQVNILVNNAGIGGIRPVWGTPKRSFEAILAVNLIGTFLCTKHVWRPMRDAGGGSIINVSSLGGLQGYSLLSAYCASKFGQIGYTKACAEEGKYDNIRVNAIAPGKVDTALRAQIKEDKSRMLKAEDHIGLCVFLASDESRYVTGQVFPIEWYGPKVRE